jgi:oligoribonuclease
MGEKREVELSRAYVWFDAEFTSLDLDRARLLQVAMLVTDRELNLLGNPDDELNLCIRIEDEQEVSAWVKEHLPGLVKRCQSDEAVSVEEADERMTAYLERFVGAPTTTINKRPLLAGNSVHNDWHLARRLLPKLCERLHYRLLDVSMLKVQWQDWAGRPPFDKENVDLLNEYFPGGGLERANAHDALFDIKASIAELAYYRRHLSVTDI